MGSFSLVRFSTLTTSTINLHPVSPIIRYPLFRKLVCIDVFVLVTQTISLHRNDLYDLVENHGFLHLTLSVDYFCFVRFGPICGQDVQ